VGVSAAGWSAIAASFAALSAFMTMRIHRRNLLDSVRPELVLTGWARLAEGLGDSAHEVIAFRSIRNVGRGPAFNVWLECLHESNNRLTASMMTTRLPILAAGEVADVDSEILIWWMNVEPDETLSRRLHVSVRVVCFDSQNRRHKTEYSLHVEEIAPGVAVADALFPGVTVTGALIPGVMLIARATRTRTVRSLRTQARLARTPLLGRPFRRGL